MFQYFFFLMASDIVICLPRTLILIDGFSNPNKSSERCSETKNANQGRPDRMVLA